MAMQSMPPVNFDQILQRAIRAAKLEPAVYNEVEHDLTATPQAAVVVGVVAIATVIGALGSGGSFFGALIGGIVFAFLGWVIWAYATFYVGTKMFGGTATPGEMLRCLGYAQAPGVLRVLGFIPVIGFLVNLVLFFWTIATGVIAIREALDIDTGKAVLTAIISAVLVIVALAVVSAILAGIGLGILAV